MTTQAAVWDSLDEHTAQTAQTVSDLDLVDKTRQGEIEAFSELVRRHQRVVYNLAYRFMRECTSAEDMAQEAFLKAFRMLHGFRGECEFSTWMYRVTCSVCLTELNRRKKRNEVALHPEALTAAVVPQHDAVDLRDIMRVCVAQLPQRYENIITLYYLRELSYEEIAAKLDIPMGTLKTWMHRARKHLRRIVERELYA
jgi:RNA polymerase sigma-70 factor, ECF subfamily